MLWECCSDDLPVKSNRRTSLLRSEKDAHVEDILDALNKLDESQKRPRILIDAHHLSKIPRSHPEELNDISLLDRLNQLEQKMADHGTTLDKYIGQNMVLNDKVEELTKKHTPTYAAVASDTKQQSQIPSVVVSAPSAPPGPPPPPPIQSFAFGRARGRASNQGPHHNEPPRPGHSLYTNMPQSSNNMYGSTYSLDKSPHRSEAGSYHYSSYHQKKERQKQKRVVQGKGNSKCGVKGAPEPSRHLFIFRVHKDTSLDDMKNHLIDSVEGLDIRDLGCVSHTDAKFQSFKLTVPLPQFDQLFNDELWPDGVRVRQFIPPRQE